MQNDPIIEISLQEETERLHYLLSKRGNMSAHELESTLVEWANSLLEDAYHNEPGQVKLLPPPVKRQSLIHRLPHQKIGS